MIFRAMGIDDITQRVTVERTEEREGRLRTESWSIPKI